MDKYTAALDILHAALPAIAFDGWTDNVLINAAEAIGYDRHTVTRVFPGGPVEAIRLFITEADQYMADAYAMTDTAAMKLGERVQLAIRLRLEHYGRHREAVRRAASSLALHPHIGAATLYQTVNAVWYLVGDKSFDFSWYTKRATLAGVYSATLLYWLNDESAGHEGTWEFLRRRIDNVLAFGRFKRDVKAWIKEPKFRRPL